MSEWYKVGGRFVLRHGASEQAFRVRTATVTFVRHPGGVAMALSALTDSNESGSDPVGASLSIVLNGADANRAGASRWCLGRECGWGAVDGLPPPMLYLDDMHPIGELSLDVSEALDKRLVLLEGTAGVFEFRMTACARFGGVTNLDPTLPPGGRWWAGHHEKFVAWPSGGPLTSAIWTDTNEFRRLVQACFPLRTSDTVAPEGRLKAFARRLGLLPPPPPPPPPAFVPPCSDRQAQFLLAAFVERFLADERPNGSPEEFREVARIVERFADRASTDADRRATAPVIGRTCLNERETILNDFSPSSAKSLLRLVHFVGASDSASLLHGLFPERSRHGCDLLRDVLGDPFHPIRFDASSLTPTVVSIARGIHGERAFDRMPVLADALEETGCANEEALAHCRGDWPHVRGCWVVEGILRST